MSVIFQSGCYQGSRWKVAETIHRLFCLWQQDLFIYCFPFTLSFPRVCIKINEEGNDRNDDNEEKDDNDDDDDCQ